jgi:hypothetical protein
MMRVVLEFDLPEDLAESQQAFHADQAWTALREIAAEVRRSLKYEAEPVACLRRVQEISDEVFGLLGG